ncbi:DUF1491 family protein [Histidinibacterium aquaticum]|uniref:DUF1491 family protein n=1 Tax=Histidinibacterium aquaticum TaxID=2613962 RepID=A0A5J5GG24_9RHOB|nr:DUF1491 family protein [Histidinibacterium aquaticum]KAA9007081.1 DUF1491 family protein [Histidinibacterium aquaticum]
MTARLASGLWVSAYLQRLQMEGIAVYIAARGDTTAGAVMVKCATMDGRAACHERVLDLSTGGRRWEKVAEGSEEEIDGLLARSRSRDPDLWVVEVEDRMGRHLLDDPSLQD